MTDRELLELAAKAAGIKVRWCNKIDTGYLDPVIEPHPRPHWVMEAFIAHRLHLHDDAEELAHALLDAQDFRIVLLGPKTGVRETGQGPAGPQAGRLGFSGDDT